MDGDGDGDGQREGELGRLTPDAVVVPLEVVLGTGASGGFADAGHDAVRVLLAGLLQRLPHSTPALLPSSSSRAQLSGAERAGQVDSGSTGHSAGSTVVGRGAGAGWAPLRDDGSAQPRVAVPVPVPVCPKAGPATSPSASQVHIAPLESAPISIAHPAKSTQKHIAHKGGRSLVQLLLGERDDLGSCR